MQPEIQSILNTLIKVDLHNELRVENVYNKQEHFYECAL
jgi:hypothetical protein